MNPKMHCFLSVLLEYINIQVHNGSHNYQALAQVVVNSESDKEQQS